MIDLADLSKIEYRILLLIAFLLAFGLGSLLAQPFDNDEPDCAWHTVIVEAHSANPWRAGAESMPVRVCLDKDGHVR
jgi:hypothetical protein